MGAYHRIWQVWESEFIFLRTAAPGKELREERWENLIPGLVLETTKKRSVSRRVREFQGMTIVPPKKLKGGPKSYHSG